MAIQEIKVWSKEQLDGSATGAVVYRYEGVSVEEAEKLQTYALTDRVAQHAALNPEAPPNGAVEIAYKPGVTDPIEHSLRKVADLLGIQPRAVSSSRIVRNHVMPSQIETVVSRKPETLIAAAEAEPLCHIPICAASDEALLALSEERSLFLNPQEMQMIQAHYRALGREPTDVELEMFAQTWSEHNGHKTFKAKLVDEHGREIAPLFARLKETSQKFFAKAGVMTAFADNAGGIHFYDGYAIIAKGETHNSPVAIDPYAGALTKNGGLYRDIAGCGQGGRNLVSFMINNFAAPNTPPEAIPPGCLHPKQLLLENARGEREYGNPMGIPTHGITLHFHPDFAPKPTSLGIVIGLIPEDRVAKGRPQPGDLLVTVGGKTGRDGIHGATVSSGMMTAKTQTVHATAVQLGDPIVERTMFDALLACRDANLIRAITDCGGGGYSSAIGEMAAEIGATIDLSCIPLKYAGLASWEKWLSESQERMIVALDPLNWSAFQAICNRYAIGATIIGHFTGDNRLTLVDGDAVVAQVDLAFLHEGLPQRSMPITCRAVPQDDRVPEPPPDLVDAYKAVLGHLNVCSKEIMHRQYDQTVQATTVLAPFTGVYQDTPNDGSVIAPFADKPYGIVTAHALNPILNRLDPYWGAIWAFAHAATRYTAIGGDIRLCAGIDNFIWPFPDTESLGDLNQSVTALCEMLELFQLPLVSGKDSLSSTYRHPDGTIIKAPPSLNITLFGKIPDVAKTVSCDFKKIGATICLLGRPDANRLGGSIYFETQGILNSHVPRVDFQNLPRRLNAVSCGIDEGKIYSSKAIGEGGLAAALALMCFGGDCGAAIDVAPLAAGRVDFALFNETTGCLLVEVDSPQTAKTLFAHIPYAILGTTTAEKAIVMTNGHTQLMKAELLELKEAWQRPMEEICAGD